MSIFLFLLSRFSPCLWLSPFLLWLVYLWISLHLSYEFVELPWCVMSSNIFGKFSTIISSNTFFALISVSFPGIHIVCVLGYLYCLIFLNICLFFFILFFSLLFRLHNLYQSSLNFANYFFCLFKLTVEPLQWIFHFSYWNFQLQNFHLVPFIIYSPLLILSTCCNIVIIPFTMSLIIVSF